MSAVTTYITWHGHANFQIRQGGLSIVIDPFFTGNPAAKIGWEAMEKPDLTLVTHMHGDHAGDAVNICKHYSARLGTIVGAAGVFEELGVPAPLILNNGGFNIGGELVFKGARIIMTEAFHTSEAGSPAGYIIILPDGFTLYHAGDTGIFMNMRLWGELYPLDLALLPAGDVYTMGPRQAARAASLLNPRCVIPMHWGTFPVLAQSMDAFEQELAALSSTGALPRPCEAVIMRPGETVTFNRV